MLRGQARDLPKGIALCGQRISSQITRHSSHNEIDKVDAGAILVIYATTVQKRGLKRYRTRSKAADWVLVALCANVGFIDWKFEVALSEHKEDSNQNVVRRHE